MSGTMAKAPPTAGTAGAAAPAPITPAAFRTLARARLRDAKVLLSGKRYDGAYYMCGYAVEMMLKARICQTLKWTTFSGDHVKSLKVHDLPFLLKFSGVEPRVTKKYFAEWSKVQDWKVENRYDPTRSITLAEATDMVTAAERLLKVL
jgi:HEPN domain-containing protein